MIELKRISPASVDNPEVGGDVLFLNEQGVYYTKDSTGALKVLGNGISGVVKSGTAGLVDTYRITFDSGDTFDYTVTNGDDGRSVQNIEKTSTVGLVDTYTVTYSEAPLTSTFTVTNARSIVDVIPPANPGQPGATDTYTIDFNDGPNDTFTVYNGTNGLNGQGTPTTVVAAPVGNTGSAGTAGPEYANPDHVHAHGNQTNPAHHAVATTESNGFMSDADKTKLDGVQAGAEVNQNAFSVITGNTGTASADTKTDTIAITGGTGISTAATDTPDGLVITNTDTGSAARTAHEAAVDPHPQYTTTAEAAAAAPVQSFNGRTGSITPQQADYDAFFTTPAEASAAAPVQSIVAGTGITVSGATGNVTVNNAGVTSVSVNGGAAQTGAVSVTTPAPKLSATISSLFASPANSTAVTVVISLAIPAGYLTAGKTFDFDLEGTQSQSAAATNVVGAIFVNGTQLVSAAVAGGTAAQTNRSIRMKGGIMWNGANYLGNITTGISGVLPVGNANVTGVAVAAGTAHNIDIRVQTSTANAANIIRAVAAAIKEA